MTDEPSEGDSTASKDLRFYDPYQIGLFTFFFGPLAGAWYLSRNWKAFGDEGAAFRTMLTGWAGTMLMIVCMQFLPEEFPKIVLPLAYVGIVECIVKTQQQAGIESLKAAGVPRASTIRAFSVGLLWLAIMVVSVTALFMVFPGLFPDHRK
jgi:hypothetical protein